MNESFIVGASVFGVLMPLLIAFLSLLGGKATFIIVQAVWIAWVAMVAAFAVHTWTIPEGSDLVLLVIAAAIVNAAWELYTVCKAWDDKFVDHLRRRRLTRRWGFLISGIIDVWREYP